MFGMDLAARTAINEQRAHFAALTSALAGVLVRKGICTEEEFLTEVTRQKAAIDQIVASQRDVAADPS